MERGKPSRRGSVSVNDARGASYLGSGDLLGVDETWVEVVGVSGKLQEGGVLVVLTYYLPISIPFPTGFSTHHPLYPLQVEISSSSNWKSRCGCNNKFDKCCIVIEFDDFGLDWSGASSVVHGQGQIRVRNSG